MPPVFGLDELQSTEIPYFVNKVKECCLANTHEVICEAHKEKS